jgi:hypothetical protein
MSDREPSLFEVARGSKPLIHSAIGNLFRRAGQMTLADDIASDLSSLGGSEATSSEELPWFDDYFDTPVDEIHSVPRFEYDIAETVDPEPAEITLGIPIMVGIHLKKT